ncbi:unnamed protein product [Moneuplotes crassus]|uniref:Uncharacterized protein n=1 Tax=Euplotes crassus TaxID=5936 RepID=A0AAD1XQ77_EUPCR|nr:unnamed protein product [Moneuplotes crassus]
MGSCNSQTFGQQVLVIGTKSSGKSFFLKQLQYLMTHSERKSIPDLGEFPPSTELYDFCEVVGRRGDKLSFWDLCASETMREYWPHFYRELEFSTVIYFLKVDQESDFDQARTDLLFLTSEEELRNAKFSIVVMYPSYCITTDEDEDELKTITQNQRIKNIKAQIVNQVDPDGLFYFPKNMSIYLMHYYNPNIDKLSIKSNAARFNNIEAICDSICEGKQEVIYKEYFGAYESDPVDKGDLKDSQEEVQN